MSKKNEEVIVIVIVFFSKIIRLCQRYIVKSNIKNILLSSKIMNKEKRILMATLFIVKKSTFLLIEMTKSFN